MLVLSRKAGESIHIGSEIFITVVSIANGRVKLGFEAPDHVRILRSELKRIHPAVLAGKKIVAQQPVAVEAGS